MSDYDFIFNSQPKRRGGGFAQNPFQRKLLLFGFISVVLIFVIIVGSALLNSGKPSASSYVPITVYQEELIRILENKDELRDESLRAKYTTLYLALLGDYDQSTAYLSKNGVVITPELRSPYYYFDLESDLETAASANRFDAELTNYVDTALEDYSEALINLSPTPGQQAILDQAKQNIIYYNGRIPDTSEQ